jgi:hypothetical protein
MVFYVGFCLGCFIYARQTFTSTVTVEQTSPTHSESQSDKGRPFDVIFFQGAQRTREEWQNLEWDVSDKSIKEVATATCQIIILPEYQSPGP